MNNDHFDDIICDEYKCLLFSKKHPMYQHVFYKHSPLMKKCEYETCNCFILGKDKFCSNHLIYFYNNETYPIKIFNNPINPERKLDTTNSEKLIYDKNIEIIKQQLIANNFIISKKNNNANYTPPSSPSDK